MKQKKNTVYIIILFTILVIDCSNPKIDPGDYFKGINGAFILYDSRDDSFITYNDQRCNERFTPASTFKIPNSLIALETAASPDEHTIIKWDSLRNPRSEWWNSEPFIHWAQDHTLRTAIKYSVVWFYQELARRIGEQHYKDYLQKIGYGNENISGGLDTFWLSSSLKISAHEQIDFLRKFYTNEFGFSRRTVEIVKNILILENTDNYTLSGKTGGGQDENGKSIGWFTGYVEKDDNVYFFALNLEGDDFASIAEKRISITKEILRALEILPE